MKRKNFFAPTLPTTIAFFPCFVLLYCITTVLEGVFGITWFWLRPQLPDVISENAPPLTLLDSVLDTIRRSTPADYLLYVIIAVLAYLSACTIGYFIERPGGVKTGKEK